MGWSDCGINKTTGEPMGYSYEGQCSHPDCEADIDHGLAYVCGGMHEGGEHGCGRYFCYEHLMIVGVPVQLCIDCYNQYR